MGAGLGLMSERHRGPFHSGPIVARNDRDRSTFVSWKLWSLNQWHLIRPLQHVPWPRPDYRSYIWSNYNKALWLSNNMWPGRHNLSNFCFALLHHMRWQWRFQAIKVDSFLISSKCRITKADPNEIWYHVAMQQPYKRQTIHQQPDVKESKT